MKRRKRSDRFLGSEQLARFQNPPRDGRGDRTNIARAIGEQENVALVRGLRHAVEDSTYRYEALPWPCAIRK